METADLIVTQSSSAESFPGHLVAQKKICKIFNVKKLAKDLISS